RNVVDAALDHPPRRVRIRQICDFPAAREAGRGRRMIFVRAVLFNLYLYSLTAGIAVFASPCLLMPRQAVVRIMEIWAHCVRWGLRRIARIEIEFRGERHLDPERLRGGVMVASKHQSMLDTIMVSLLLKDPAIVMKRELIAIPFYGWYALRVG